MRLQCCTHYASWNLNFWNLKFKKWFSVVYQKLVTARSTLSVMIQSWQMMCLISPNLLWVTDFVGEEKGTDSLHVWQCSCIHVNSWFVMFSLYAHVQWCVVMRSLTRTGSKFRGCCLTIRSNWEATSSTQTIRESIFHLSGISVCQYNGWGQLRLRLKA